jgi:hypothetical protein
MIDYTFLYAFSKQLLNLDKSIRWMAISDKFGIILNAQYREGLKPLLTQEQNEEYALSTMTRHKTRTRFESKTGKVIYAFGRYEKLNRVTIPINDNYFLLLTLDVEERNYDEILMKKVISLIEKERHNFVVDYIKSKG